MEILIIGAGVLLSLFLGIVLISLLVMAQKTDRVNDLMPYGEEMVSPVDTYLWPAPETLSPTSRHEERPQRDLVDCGGRMAQ